MATKQTPYKSTRHAASVLVLTLLLALAFAVLGIVNLGPEIVAERPMYFDYGGGWEGGHDVVGYLP